MVKRSTPFIEVAFFLSKYGTKTPPEILQTTSWREAYHMFYEQLSQGRTISAFVNSLNNARDAFDSHFPDTHREGWKDKAGKPNQLSEMSLAVLNNSISYPLSKFGRESQNTLTTKYGPLTRCLKILLPLRNQKKKNIPQKRKVA